MASPEDPGRAHSLGGVKLVISDTHEGLRNAVTHVLCATWKVLGSLDEKRLDPCAEKVSTPWPPLRSTKPLQADAAAAHSIWLAPA